MKTPFEIYMSMKDKFNHYVDDYDKQAEQSKLQLFPKDKVSVGDYTYMSTIQSSDPIIGAESQCFYRQDDNVKGIVPRTHETDAGQDICSSEDITIPARGSAVVHTGVYISIPKSTVARLGSKSGLSCKHNIEVGAGWVDSSYRGEIMVKLYNHGDSDYKVSKGDKIAQIILMPILLDDFVIVTKLDDTTRGADGFGSTGK